MEYKWRERYFFPGKVGQKQNGTRFPLAADGEMSARLNGHVFHDDDDRQAVSARD
jgi:hypothetical protein